MASAANQARDLRLGEVLVEQGLVQERDLAQLVAQQEDLEFVDLGKVDLDQQAVNLLSERTARLHRAIAFRFVGPSVVVAVVDPTDTGALDTIVGEVPGGVRFVVVIGSELDAALTEAFGEEFPAAAG